MNNDTKQRQIEHEIMELEDRLAHKKEQLEQLNRINTNDRYFLDEGGGVRELIPPVNILAWEKVIRQGNTFKTVEDAEKESDRRTLLYEFNQFRDECNGDWKADFEDSNPKHCIVLNNNRLTTLATFKISYFAEFGYFERLSDCERAIEIFGDRILELYVD